MNVAAQSELTVDPREQSVSRFELWAVVAITLIGATVRFAFPSAMAIEHFDEGVYASNLLFSNQGNEYPDRHLYAPSLVPALIEWSIILFGDKGIAPMLPSLLFGTLTIPLIWWVGRQWFGPLSGIAAATLLSLSDFHIAFSRSALTDVPLCFWLLLAVYFFERAFRDLSWPTAIAAGLTTGLAWWTKYNGWLPLAISLSGLIGWSLFARRDERHFLHRIGLWAIAASAAIIAWSPYWLSLPHGYAEVARNHSQYVVGFSGWVNGATRQRDSLYAFGSLISCGGFMAAICGAIWRCPRSSNNSPSTVRQFVFAGWLVLGAAIGTMAFSANFWFLMSAFNVTFLVLASVVWTAFSRIRNNRNPSPETSISPMTGLVVECRFHRADWLIIAWMVGLIVSVPLYRPYPRLALPGLVGTILILIAYPVLAQRTDQRTPEQQKAAMKEGLWHIPFGLVCGGFFLLLAPFDHAFKDRLVFRCWETRSQFREIARNVTDDALKNIQAANQRPIQNTHIVLYVYAEPGLFFHLPADGLAVQPAGNLNFVDIEATRKLPTFLVTGPHAHRSQVFADEFAKRVDRFELIASYPYDTSDFVRLDDVSATQLRARRDPLEVRLYRVRVPE